MHASAYASVHRASARSALRRTAVLVVTAIGVTPPAVGAQTAKEYVLRYACGDHWFGLNATMEAARSDGEVRVVILGFGGNAHRFEFRGRRGSDGTLELKSREKMDLCYADRKANLVLSGDWTDAGVFTLTANPPNAQHFHGTAQGWSRLDRYTREVTRIETESRRRAADRAKAARIEADRQQNKLRGWEPPELGSGGQVSSTHGLLEYTDWNLNPNEYSPLSPGVLAIDAANQWALDQGYKCLRSDWDTMWQDHQVQFSTVLGGQWMYMVECDGDCSRLRYYPGSQRAVIAQGVGVPVSAFKVYGGGWSSESVTWTFVLPDDQVEPPRIRVHAWSDTTGDYGPGCSFLR